MELKISKEELLNLMHTVESSKDEIEGKVIEINGMKLIISVR